MFSYCVTFRARAAYFKTTYFVVTQPVQHFSCVQSLTEVVCTGIRLQSQNPLIPHIAMTLPWYTPWQCCYRTLIQSRWPQQNQAQKQIRHFYFDF